MADIFNEVEEDIRKARMENLWKKYGKFLIAGAVGAMLITGVVSYSKTAKLERETAATTRLIDALETMRAMPSAEGMVALEAFADESPEGVAMLARFAAAGRAADAENASESARLYDVISGDDSLPLIYREMAEIEAILVLFDTAEMADITARIEALGATRYFQLTLAELRAMAKVKEGDLYGAEVAFEAISMDTNAPQPQRDRARELANYFGQIQYRAAQVAVVDIADDNVLDIVDDIEIMIEEEEQNIETRE